MVVSMVQEGSKDFWAKFYSGSLGDNPLTDIPSTFTTFCTPFISKDGGTLIEFGCGNGRDARHFASMGLDYVGVDSCPSAIANCKTSGLHSATFHQASFCDKDLAPDDEAFDYVYSRFAFHSVTAADESVAIANVHRILRPGGLCFMEARTVNDPRCGRGRRIGTNEFIDTHYRRFLCVKDIGSSFEQQGFSLISVSEEYHAARYLSDHAVVVRIVAQKLP